MHTLPSPSHSTSTHPRVSQTLPRSASRPPSRASATPHARLPSPFFATTCVFLLALVATLTFLAAYAWSQIEPAMPATTAVLANPQPTYGGDQVGVVSANVNDGGASSANTANTTDSVGSTSAVSFNRIGWLETRMNGVRFGLPYPEGWATDAHDGIIMAEHMAGLNTSAPTANLNDQDSAGLLMYVFAPLLAGFDLDPDADNLPLAVLQQVVTMPHEIGQHAAASVPHAFTWGGQAAAYYLLSSADGTRTIVLALRVPQTDPDAQSERSTLPALVVVNASTRDDDGARLRAALPGLLDGFTVNDIRLNAAGLNDLPDPLPFPELPPADM